VLPELRQGPRWNCLSEMGRRVLLSREYYLRYDGLYWICLSLDTCRGLEEMVMSRPRVLVADDHSVILAGLVRLLEAEFDLVGAVEDGRAALESVQRLKPDVIVLDISMPVLNGIDAAAQIRKVAPKTRIIFLTMHTDVAFMKEALRAGASGYVAKRSAASELVTAIHEVLKGRTYITPLLTREMIDSFLNTAAQPDELSLRLTQRQREVLQLVAEGRSNKEIGAILKITTKTVEFHKFNLMQTLGIHTTAELTQYALKHGFISV
jgi:DNA-binding NarL/FixJ family response regulator